MNLSKLFEMQKALDEKIIKEKGLEGQDLLPQKILALQVEIGECANEWRGFKFWSKNQNPRNLVDKADGTPSNPLLEEYVDCLHFILSIGLEIGGEPENVILWTYQEPLQNFIDTMRYAALLHDDDYYQGLLESFLSLGQSLGFTWEQIEQAYMSKNEVNHNRQANGY